MVWLCPGRRGLQMYSILALVILSLAIPAAAQILKVQNPGTGSVTLDKDWRLHLGDDTQWADPSLDDSSWEPIRVDEPWGAQSHPSYTGFAWYRLRIEVEDVNAAGAKKLALLIPPVQMRTGDCWDEPTAALLPV